MPNFQDYVKLGSDTVLRVEGNAVVVGTDTGAKTVIFSNGAEGHLAWNPTGTQTIHLPDASGTLALMSDVNTVVRGVGVSTGGNTSGDTGSRTGTVVLAGIGIVTLSQATGAGGGTISVSAVQTVQPGIQSLSAGTTRITTGEVVLSDSNGVSFGVNGQTITASISAISGIGVSTGGNSAGDTGSRTGIVVMAGGAGIIASQATGALSNTISIVNSWSTATTASQVSNANAVGANAGRFALEAHQHAGIAAVGVSTGGNTAGNTGTQFGTVVFHGSNNVTLSQATGAGGVHTIFITGPAGGGGTNVTALGVSTGGNTAGNTGTTQGTIVLAGINAITLSQSTAAGNNATIEIQGPASATTISRVDSANVIGTRGSRFALEDHQHAGLYSISVLGNTAGNTSAGAGSFALAGGPNVTLSGSTDAGGALTLSISINSAQPFSGGISTMGNTAGTTGLVATRLVLVGSNAITLSQSVLGGNSATLTILGPASATTISQVASDNAIGTRGSRFALEDHQHGGVPALAAGSNTGNTAGNTATQFGTWVIAGTNNVTVSGSTGGAGVHTAWISAAGGGAGAAQSVSYYRNVQLEMLTTNALTLASFTKRPIFFPLEMSAQINGLSSIELWLSRPAGTSLNITHGVAFYSINNSTQLTLISSTSQAISVTTSAQFSGLRIYNFTGLGALTLSATKYVMAYLISGSNNSTAVANLAAMGGQTWQSIAGSVHAGTNSTGATNASNHVYPFWGVYTATSGGFPNAVARADIAGQGNSTVNLEPLVVLRNI